MARSARSRTWSSVTRHRRSRLAGQHRRPAETGDHPATVGPASSAGDASSTGVAGADELVRRRLSWFAVAALAYRVAITSILVAGALGNLGTDIPRSLLAGLAEVLTGDLVLLVGVSMGRFRGLLRSPAFLAVDLAVATGLNLWATSTLQHGTFLWTGRDIVWGYGLGVISFWTALRGARTGAAILAGADDGMPAERLREIRATALQQATELRGVLREDSARQGGLTGGLHALTEEFLHRGLHTELVTGGLDRDPPPAVATALIGATREALTNVAKHADAGRAVVRAVSRPDGVEVIVRDHGRGFDLETEHHGFGVERSITSRMHEVGGRAELWSAPGRGTRVMLWGPR